MSTEARPLITWPDLLALVRESLAKTEGEEFEAWAEREAFDPKALVRVARLLLNSWRASGESNAVLALTCFSIGWDAHRELRGESDGPRDGAAGRGPTREELVMPVETIDSEALVGWLDKRKDAQQRAMRRWPRTGPDESTATASRTRSAMASFARKPSGRRVDWNTAMGAA